MSSKVDYLKKYLSEKTRTKKKRNKRKANLAIHDDDIDWSSIAPRMEGWELEEDDDPDAAPVVASFKDESVRKWMPVETFDREKNSIGISSNKLLEKSSVYSCSSSESDLDPIRKDHTYSTHMSDKSDSDLSPPRPRCVDEDLSPPRSREKKNVSVRKPHQPDVLSWSKQEVSKCSLPIKRSRHDSVSPPGTPKTVSPHFHLGHKKESQESLGSVVPNSPKSKSVKSTNAVEHGRYAETVYRDKFGKKIDLKLEKIKKREEERRQDEANEVFMEWGRGIVQTKSAHEKIADDIYEMSKPFARYADDEDLEKMLKEREREGDPMLAFLKKKSETSQKGDPKVKKMKPTYRGSAPPNRFDVRPGYRWDGVNRSNGFEKTWFQRQSNQRAVADEAYKWSVEDM